MWQSTVSHRPSPKEASVSSAWTPLLPTEKPMTMRSLRDGTQDGETQLQPVRTVALAQVTATTGNSVSRPAGASAGPAKGQV